MKTKWSSVAVLFAVASLVVSIIALSKKPEVPELAGGAKPASPRVPISAGGVAEKYEARIAAVEQSVGIDRTESETEEQTPAPIGERLDAIEASLAKLTSAFEGISLESASEDRDALFRAEDGYLKADEYFAAEKFAIAGEGYLKFLEANPDHPEAYDILKRARQAFTRAGYKDKAVWAQEQLLANLGDERLSSDALLLAQLKKDAGDYEGAIKYANEAVELSPETNDRLWNRMYWAWYNQLENGDAAGLAAYREVQREIDAAGKTDEKIGERVREKIEEIERAGGGKGGRSTRRTASS